MRTLIITIVAIIAILGWNSARADQLQDILADKVPINSGVCSVNLKGEMTKVNEEVKERQECILILDPADDGHAYFLIFVKNKPHRLIKTNQGNIKQEVIWRNPDGMV